MGFLLSLSLKSHLLFFFLTKNSQIKTMYRCTSHKKSYIFWKMLMYYPRLLLKFCLKSHLSYFFLTKNSKIKTPQKLSIFYKNVIKNQWFRLQKHVKYLKSENDCKVSLGALNQEFEQIWNFKICKFKIDIYKGISHSSEYFLLNSIYS